MPGSGFNRIKRIAIGAPLPTERLAHERLGKPTALAVFASDNLSSSAYATEEILRVLVPAIGLAAFGFLVPITLAMLGVLGVLLFSYRQTIKAYPQAGGAYLVTRDNFGTFPAIIAGVALLTDYILTVSVSVSAGTAALTSAVPATFAWRVAISVAFIAIIAWGNLRGVRESGKIFAAPTYFFIAMMVTLLGTSAWRLFSGTLPAPETFEAPTRGLEAATMFLILHAFASGGAAVTGVEAISNGVPAFRPPEWRNARTTLMWMGTILGVMFLGLSLVGARLRIVPDPHEQVTVNSQIAGAVFGPSSSGRLLFFLLQLGTLLILVLAANTSFADFPRLSSFLAADRFLPGQLTQYGDRLVFSNGIVVLAGASAVLVVIFKASVTRLIPLYAIGVFTSFTFSQAGMAVRHTRIKEPRWRTGFVINGTGALVSGLMTVIIATTKFSHGAWMILVAMPVLIAVLFKIHTHYQQAGILLRDPARRPPESFATQRILMAIDKPGPDDQLAAAYATKLRPEEIHVVHVGPAAQPLIEAWSRYGVSNAIEFLPPRTSVPTELRSFVREYRNQVGPHQILNVVIPEEVGGGAPASHLLRRMNAQFIKAALLSEPGIVITNVTHHAGALAPHPSEVDGWKHVALVLVPAVHNASMNALAYARSLHADAIRCLHVAVEPAKADRVVRDWEVWSPGADLEVVDSPFRDVAGPALTEVERLLLRQPQTFVTIVMPEFVVYRWWHNALHNQTALLLKRALLFEPSIAAVTSVPYRLLPAARTGSVLVRAAR